MTKAKRDLLLQKWIEANDNQKAWKEIEQACRKELDSLFDAEVESGTQTIELGQGYSLKSVRKTTYTLDNKRVQSVLDQLDPAVAERIVKMKYTLTMAEYKRLLEKREDGDVFALAQLKLIDEVVTSKQGMPVIQLVEPKA